jgi:HEAT repeat protein
VFAAIGDRRAVEPLVQLACDADEETAVAAAKALFTVFAGALSLPPLASLRASPHATVRALADRVLSELKAHSADTFEAVHEKVARAFAARQDAIPEAEIRRGITSANREVRRIGLNALLSVHAVKGIDACIAILEKGDPQDREFAVDKIVQLIRQLDMGAKSLAEKKKATVVPLRQFAVARARLIKRRTDLDTILRAILDNPGTADRPVLQRQCTKALSMLL